MLKIHGVPFSAHTRKVVITALVRRRSQRQMAKCARVLQSPIGQSASAKVPPPQSMHPTRYSALRPLSRAGDLRRWAR